MLVQRRPSRPRLSARLATTAGNRRRVDSLNGSGLGARSWSSASRIHIGAAQLRLRPTAYPLALRAKTAHLRATDPFRSSSRSATTAAPRVAAAVVPRGRSAVGPPVPALLGE